MDQEQIIFQEWRDQQGESRYPFGDDATLTTRDGVHQFSNDTFLDASLYPIGASSRVYLSNVRVVPGLVTFVLSDDQGNQLATAAVDPFTAPDVLRFTDASGRPAGVVVSDALRLSQFAAWTIGDNLFELGDTEFAASVVIPTPESGLRGLVTPDRRVLAGKVWIVGGDGVVVREQDGKIRIDIVGDPLFKRRICQPQDLFDIPVLLETINGCGPDAYGNFAIPVGGHFTQDTVLRVVPTSQGLVIEAVGRTSKES